MGTTRNVCDVSLQQGDYWFLGAGSSNVQDLGVDVSRERGYRDTANEQIVSNSLGGSLPADLSYFESSGSNYYDLKVHNQGSVTSSAFVFGFLLEM